MIHSYRRSRFISISAFLEQQYSIFLNAFFIRLFKRRSRQRKVTLNRNRMAFPLLTPCEKFMIVVVKSVHICTRISLDYFVSKLVDLNLLYVHECIHVCTLVLIGIGRTCTLILFF